MPGGKPKNNACPDRPINALQPAFANPRIICSNTKEHLQILSLYKLGLSCPEIAEITGFRMEEFQHFCGQKHSPSMESH